MNIKPAITIAAIATACLAFGCNNGGPSRSEVNSGIEEAFQAPGKIAGGCW